MTKRQKKTPRKFILLDSYHPIIKDCYKELRKSAGNQLDAVCCLPFDWNGEDSNPVSFRAAYAAADLLMLLETRVNDLSVPWIVPLPCGMVKLEWYNNGVELELTLYQDPVYIHVWAFDHKDGEYEDVCIHSEEQFILIIDWLHRLNNARVKRKPYA